MALFFRVITWWPTTSKTNNKRALHPTPIVPLKMIFSIVEYYRHVNMSCGLQFVEKNMVDINSRLSVLSF